MDAEALGPGFGEEGCAGSGEEGLFDAGVAQTAHEEEDLTLAATEFAACIEVEDAHQLMNRALAYLTKVYMAAM